MVEDALALLQAFLGVYIAGVQTTIKTGVTVVLEHREVLRLYYTRQVGGFGELAVMRNQLPAQVEAFLLLGQPGQLISLLLAAGLYREIGLAQRYDLFCWV